MTTQARRTPMPPEAPEPLHEVSTPLLAVAGACRNVTDLLLARLAEPPDHVAFEVRTPGTPVTGPWQPVTTAEFVARVGRLGPPAARPSPLQGGRARSSRTPWWPTPYSSARASHTPTLKLKRTALIARGHDIIESHYCDPRSHP